MEVVVTLKSLHTEGRLTLGDTIHHSLKGDHELVNVTIDGGLIVKDLTGNYTCWHLQLPPDCRIVPAPGNPVARIEITTGEFRP